MCFLVLCAELEACERCNRNAVACFFGNMGNNIFNGGARVFDKTLFEKTSLRVKCFHFSWKNFVKHGFWFALFNELSAINAFFLSDERGVKVFSA